MRRKRREEWKKGGKETGTLEVVERRRKWEVKTKSGNKNGYWRRVEEKGGTVRKRRVEKTNGEESGRKREKRGGEEDKKEEMRREEFKKMGRKGKREMKERRRNWK